MKTNEIFWQLRTVNKQVGSESVLANGGWQSSGLATSYISFIQQQARSPCIQDNNKKQ